MAEAAHVETTATAPALKVLINWVNYRLGLHYKHVANAHDFSDGVVLAYLIAEITQVDMFNFEPSVKFGMKRTHFIQNVEIVWKVLQKRGVTMPAEPTEIVIAAEDKLYQSVFQIAMCYYGSYKMTWPRFRADIMRQIKKRIDPYWSDLKNVLSLTSGIEIINLSSALVDGGIFLAVMYVKDKTAVNLKSIESLAPEARLKMALDIGESRFKMPKLFDVEWVLKHREERMLALYIHTLFQHMEMGERRAGGGGPDRSTELVSELEEKSTELNNFRNQTESDMKQRERQWQEEKKVLEAELAERNSQLAIANNKMDVTSKKQYALERQLLESQTMLTSYQERLRKLEAQHQLIMEEKARHIDMSIPAPTGMMALMFTDVQASTKQWDIDPEAMALALSVHNRCIRDLLKVYDGYEVKTEGDAFMVAFADPVKAVRCAMAIQEDLMVQEWPPRILQNEDSREERDAQGRLIWKGLRVRMGFHMGEPLCNQDPTTGRMDYFGPVVNASARVGGYGNGGQVVISGQVYDRVMEDLGKEVVYKELGSHILKGLKHPLTLRQVLPPLLSVRVFAEKSAPTPKVNMMEAMEAEMLAARKAADGADARISEMQQAAQSLTADVVALQTAIDADSSMSPEHKKVLQRVLSESSQLRQQLVQLAESNQRLSTQVNMLAGMQGPDMGEKNQAQRDELRRLKKDLDEAYGRIRELEDMLETGGSIRRKFNGFGASHAPYGDRTGQELMYRPMEMQDFKMPDLDKARSKILSGSPPRRRLEDSDERLPPPRSLGKAGKSRSIEHLNKRSPIKLKSGMAVSTDEIPVVDSRVKLSPLNRLSPLPPVTFAHLRSQSPPPKRAS